MNIPKVGPVVSLAFVAPIDIPAQFWNSKTVRPVLGLTPVRNQYGKSDRVGRISLCGDGMRRTLLFEAAQTMLRQSTRWSWLKAWAMKVAQRRGSGMAVVALARRVAVIMHRMWRRHGVPVAREVQVTWADLADHEYSDQGEPRASAPEREAVPCGMMNEVSSKPSTLLAHLSAEGRCSDNSTSFFGPNDGRAVVPNPKRCGGETATDKPGFCRADAGARG